MVNTNKQPSLIKKAMTKKKVIAACFSSIFIIALAIGLLAYKNTVYEILINGTSVGYVKEHSTLKTALNHLSETDGKKAAEGVIAKRRIVFDTISSDTQPLQASPENGTSSAPIKTESVNSNADNKHYISSEKIESLARSILGLKQPAIALSIDGNQVAVVQDQDTALKVIEEIKAYYTPDNDSSEVLSVEIREEIQTANTYEYVQNLMDCDSVVQKIVTGDVTPESYTIEQGDTIWDISTTNGISIDDIQSQNPELDIEKLQIGDVINLSTAKPYVNVEVVANITSEETVAYETEKVKDSTLLKGKTKVKQTGQNGSKNVVIKTTKVNGITTNEEIISSTVVKEPVKEIVYVGTKVVTTSATPSRGTVSSKGFIRPANGILTSNYGWRSRGFHTGVDFASSTGTPIVASKAGTVTFSGWKGSYGNCVIIDHGNGISTLYAHNSSNKVSVGASVAQGQTIALMGSTGNSTGPHVHFEVRINGAYKNPWNYIN